MPKSVMNVRAVVMQGLAVLVICAIIEIVAGNFLEKMKESLTVAIPALLVMIPPLLALRGNINGALASRLGTALHTGVIEAKYSLSGEMRVNVTSSLILNFLASTTIGILSSVVGVLVGKTVNFLSLIGIAVVAGMISGIILAVLTVVVAVASFRRGWDPDNITAPLMATIGDLVTTAAIFLTVILGV